MADKPKTPSTGGAVKKRQYSGNHTGKARPEGRNAGDQLQDFGKKPQHKGEQRRNPAQKPQSAGQTPENGVKKKQRIAKRPGGFAIRIKAPASDVTKLTLKICITAAALMAAVTLFIAGADLRPSEIAQGFRDKNAFLHASGRGYPIEIHGSRTVRAQHVTCGTAVLTDVSYTLYDGRGREVITESHHFTSPSMECAGKYSLLFDRPGQSYVLRNLTGTACSGSLEDSIICGAVSESGKFALVTNSELINANVNVFSRDGRQIYKWKSVENKISDVTVSPSGRHIALSGVSTRKGVMIYTVIVQEIGAKKNLREFTFEDTLIADIAFDGNSRIVAVGDDSSYFLDIRSGEVLEYPYNGRTLNGYDISPAGKLALVFSENSDGRNSSVVVIDDKCKELAFVDTSMTSPFVDFDGSRLNLLCQSTVTSFDLTGKVLREAEVQADCQEILTSEGRLLAKGVMYMAEIS